MAVSCRFNVIFPAVQQAVKKREQCLQVSFVVFIMLTYSLLSFRLFDVVTCLIFFNFLNGSYALQYSSYILSHGIVLLAK